MSDSRPLADRVALVTGVSRRAGIGFAIARRLARMGADVFIHSFVEYDANQPWGKDPEGVRAIVAALKREEVQVAHVDADLSEEKTPARLLAAAQRTLGPVDILVVNHATDITGALEELSTDHIDRSLHVNVRASLLLTQAFVKQHKGRAGGRIVFMTGSQHREAMPWELPTVASKGALHHLVPSLSAYLANRGITVNGVNPGATDTGWANEELRDTIRELQPQGRLGQPEDAARLVCWLASDEAQWITGQIIDSDGGGP